MSVSSISSDFSTLSLVDLLQEAQKEQSSILDSSTTLASANALLSSAQSKRAQNAYGGSASSAIGQAALKKALSEMTANGGAVTFKDVAEYREQLEAEFSVLLRVALAEKGVSLETEFTLNMDSDGKISVNCDDALAKETIQQYLADNPEACEQFGYIQALANLERARQSPAGASAAWQEARNATKEFQAQAIEAFFDAALGSGMGYSSLLATFTAASAGSDTAASTSFYAGLNFTV